MTFEAERCGVCDTPRPAGASFCANCGNAFTRPPASTPPPPPVPPGAVTTFSIAAAAVAVGGGLMVAGAFLPWVTANVVFTSISRTGLELGDGNITLVLGIAIGLIGIAATLAGGRSGFRWFTAILAIVGLVVVAYDFIELQNRLDTIDESFRGLATVGVGLYATGAGAAVAFLASLSMQKR